MNYVAAALLRDMDELSAYVAFCEAVRLAMRKGLVLVLSLWGGGDMSWLDGGCRGAYQQCQLGSAQAVVSNLRVENASRKGGAVLVEGR